ncbi:tRNA (adenosine(37)-N6)-threonylcarbamoyltransferase complex dimerization subunit type 1 TsaB [Deltaproteobacteria bacterium TL4]
MNILAIDTAFDALAISLVQKNKPVAYYYSLCRKRTSKIVFQVLEDLLTNAQMAPAEIDLYVVNQGPGSYTGVRIGMSLIKTLAQVHAKPLVAVSSLQLLAAQTIPVPERFYVLLNCSRSEVFYAPFQYQNQQLTQLASIQWCLLDQLLEQIPHDYLVLKSIPEKTKGPLWETLKGLPMKDDNTNPNPYQLLLLGKEAYQKNTLTTFDHIHPLYVKKDIEPLA